MYGKLPLNLAPNEVLYAYQPSEGQVFVSNIFHLFLPRKLTVNTYKAHIFQFVKLHFCSNHMLPDVPFLCQPYNCYGITCDLNTWDREEF